MLDIEKELQNIIISHGLDESYPWYQEKYCTGQISGSKDIGFDWGGISHPYLRVFTTEFLGKPIDNAHNVNYALWEIKNQLMGRISYGDAALDKPKMLKQYLFCCLYAKDFPEAFWGLEEFEALIGVAEAKAIKDELQALIAAISKALRERKQEDIIIYWVDMLPYEDKEMLPCVNKRMNEGLFFTNSYTVTPWTNPTLRTMFSNRTEITGGGYGITSLDRETSPLVAMLEDDGFDIKIYSCYFGAYASKFTVKPNETEHAPSTINLWNMVKSLVESDKKQFAIIQMVQETHLPCICAMTDPEDIAEGKVILPTFKQEHIIATGTRCCDRMFGFYDALLPESTERIIMSDHGRDKICKPWSAYHTVFSIISPKVEPGIYTDIFSLLDFYPLVDCMIHGGDFKTDLPKRKYSPIEQLPPYNRTRCEMLSKGSLTVESRNMGAQGFINQDEIFISYTTGGRFYSRGAALEARASFFVDSFEEGADLEHIKWLESQIKWDMSYLSVGNYKNALIAFPMFNVWRRNHFIKRQVVNELVSYCKDGLVALRTGHYASNIYMQMLTPENRKRVVAVVDINEECFCHTQCGMRLVTPDKVSSLGVSRLINTSCAIKKDSLLAEQKRLYPEVEICDIYEALDARNDIVKMQYFDFFWS